MRERFGAERAGLSTGDASIQTDSPIMVMTTEILRNILYRTEEDSAADDDSSIRDSLGDVGLIVLDEVCLNSAACHCIMHRHISQWLSHQAQDSVNRFSA